MRRFLLSVMALLFLAVVSQSAFAADQCLTCHKNLGDKPSSLIHKDIHSSKGISCATCHGGDPNKEDMEAAMDKAAGFKGAPKGDDVSLMCASCHGDATKMKSYGSTLPTNQWDHLKTSVHGKLAISGKEHIVQCVTCHNVHEIVSVKNPASPVYPTNVVKTCTKCHSDATFMKDYNASLPVDQLEKYRTSVHGMLNEKGDIKPAECASCHGSHDIRSSKDAKSHVYPVNLPNTCGKCHSDAQYMAGYNIPTDQFSKFSKSVHGNALLVKHDVSAPACNDCHGNHGATPPGVTSISKVCGTCHALNADLFSSSPHKKAFDERKLPECETCHSNHDIQSPTEKMLGVESDAVCSQCHKENDTNKGFVVAQGMRNLMDTLLMKQHSAKALLEDAEQKGMEVSEAMFKLRDAHQAQLQARTAVHSFDEHKYAEVVNKGITVATDVEKEGRETIDEYYYRRWGLGVSTLIITILSISLFVVIKRIEAKQKLKQKEKKS